MHDLRLVTECNGELFFSKDLPAITLPLVLGRRYGHGSNQSEAARPAEAATDFETSFQVGPVCSAR
jgi:hypothetical protein